MSYTRIDLTSAVIKIGDFTFHLNSDPELGLPEHEQMMNDFDNDPERLHAFEQLLLDNPSTAFTIYINTYINN
jgi:hypothetical protein